ncbi:pseudouridine synthase [Edaphobacter acidisoli]|uniref:Pseudouridine synthase n=2 Tax=Edaphobacter acidisoli TaxID=2040573 RepID=A0A916RS65_9BACT|nr:pseudouridine synthase [Edaphobacter acidisoli]
MLPKGKRRHTVKPEYRATRDVEPETPPVIPTIDLEDEIAEDGVRTFTAAAEAAGLRLDQYLAQAIPDVSRARMQLLIEAGQVRVDGHAAKPKQKLKGGEAIEMEGSPAPPPLHAFAEDIPLDVVFEDKHLAIINKPAGMMVHAGSGATEDSRNAGTLVNALLHHFNHLSVVGGDLRPGIVHRLDKMTSGLIVVAKDDSTHRKLGEMFSAREVEKTYIALVHGNLAKDEATVDLPIGRDLVRRTRMTTRRALGSEGVRHAVSHVKVLERIAGAYGAFTLVEVRIETGRTHQIRVHMQALGHPVAGDTLYGAPHAVRGPKGELQLDRNFLHAAHLKFTHPQTHRQVDFSIPLPVELSAFLDDVRTALQGVR